MIETMAYYVTIICTILGFVCLIAGMVIGCCYLIFWMVDMFLRTKKLKEAFLEFYFQKQYKQPKAYIPDENKAFKNN